MWIKVSTAGDCGAGNPCFLTLTKHFKGVKYQTYNLLESHLHNFFYWRNVPHNIKFPNPYYGIRLSKFGSYLNTKVQDCCL